MIILVMGVMGSAKTTVGRLLAQRLGWEFADADDLHTPANIEIQIDREPSAYKNYILKHPSCRWEHSKRPVNGR